jgi:hypothetical protein
MMNDGPGPDNPNGRSPQPAETSVPGNFIHRARLLPASLSRASLLIVIHLELPSTAYMALADGRHTSAVAVGETVHVTPSSSTDIGDLTVLVAVVLVGAVADVDVPVAAHEDAVALKDMCRVRGGCRRGITTDGCGQGDG